MKKMIGFLGLLILSACMNTPAAFTATPVQPTETPVKATLTEPIPSKTRAATKTKTAVPATLTLTALASTVPAEDVPYLPNPVWQPGVTNPDVTQDNIQATICVSGYAKKIRPPVSYTDALKAKQITQYGYSDTTLADYEEDHLIALEDGGHPTDPKNLWPQPRYTKPWGAPQKDTLENVLHQMVCSGELPLIIAQQALASDWVAAYKKYIPESAIPFTPVPPEP